MRYLRRSRCLAALLGLTLLIGSSASAQQTNPDAPAPKPAPKPATAPAAPATNPPPATTAVTPATPKQPQANPPAVAPSATTRVPTAEQLDTRIKEIEADAALDEATKTKLLELLHLARTRVDAIASNTAAAAQFKDAVETAPTQAKTIRTQLDTVPFDPAAPVPLDVPPDAGVKDVQPLLDKEQADLTALKAQLAGYDDQIKAQKDRPTAARAQLADAKLKLDEIEKDLKLPPPPDEKPAVTEARKTALEARKLSRVTEVGMLDQELLSNDARLTLLTAQRDQAARQVMVAEARVKAIQDLLAKKRRDEAERLRLDAERAKIEAIGQDPVVRQIADQTAEYGKSLERLASQIERATQDRDRINKLTKQIEQENTDAQQKLDRAGLSDVVGQMLLEQRGRLPDIRRYQVANNQRRKELAEVGINQLLLQDRRRTLSDMDAAVQDAMAGVAPNTAKEQRDQIELQVRKLLKDQQDLLAKLDSSYDSYLRALTDLDVDQNALLDTAQNYANFLDERLLWIPNAAPIGSRTLADLAPAAGWLVNPTSWSQVMLTLRNALLDVPALSLLALLVFVALMVWRRRLRGKLDEIAGRVGKIHADSFPLTLAAMGITGLLAVPWPMLMMYVGWRLNESIDASPFARTVAVAVMSTAFVFLVFQLFRLFCRSGGVAEVHFRWRKQSLAVLRRNLFWLMAVQVPLTFVVTAMQWQTDQRFQHSIGRLGFMVSMAALAVFAQRVLRPGGGAVQQVLAQQHNGWLWRLRYVWFPLAIGVPLALAIMADLGYLYTAMYLASRLWQTVWLIVAIVIVRDLVLRWLFVAHRRLALEKARKKREAAAAARKDADSGESPQIAVDIPEIDLAAINEQTRHLLNAVIALSAAVGLWLVWADVLPALSILDQAQLWPRIDTGEADTTHWVTLADLALGVLLAVITVAAGRNLPGVLEIAFLQRLPLDAAGRYAITTISRYLITLIGAIVVFKVLGFAWSQVQWLIAALSVGLGFGLQEIFANFVSGLIILFEQPVRVGDVVTVSDVTGVVSRIRIRATTITDWDRKEYVVPNKEFITGRVLNWTLSDSTNRVVIKVGVAYGSDTVLARELLLRVAREHPLILSDPLPVATFEGFGDSTLNLLLRCYLPDLQNRLATITELHTAIDKAFKEAGIEIAFPQQDLHIRSIDSIIRMSNGRGDSAAAADSVAAKPNDSEFIADTRRHAEGKETPAGASK